MATKLYRIDLPYACYGIETSQNGWVVRTPPIARWMLGKRINTIETWVRKKKGTIEELESNSECLST